MNLIEPVSEDVMVAVFLKSEYDSAKCSPDLKRSMQNLQIEDSDLITSPDVSNESDNRVRAMLLGDYRGYRQDWQIFTGFPNNISWFTGELETHEIGKLHYVDYSYWNELTDNTHVVRDAVSNIRHGRTACGISNDGLIALADHIAEHGYTFEPVILTKAHEENHFVILEGHHRATALGLAGERGPLTIPVVVGLSSRSSERREDAIACQG
jgi:hypothetical protein